MPATNFTPIQLYRSSTGAAQPTAGNLQAGELAINFADGRLFYKDNAGTPAVQIIGARFGANKTIGETIAAGLSASTGITGSGALVFATSPTFVTPTLGVASATSVNKVAITAPATGSTLTIADGKTLTASNSITLAGTDSKTLTVSNSIALAGTDSTTMTFPPASASVGYLNAPINEQSADYTTVAADSGKTIFHPSTDANARTFTIAANGSVAYAVGTIIAFVNMSANNLSIAINTDTLYWAGSGATGTRTLAQYGMATALKLTSTTWLISGTNLS